MQPNKPAHDTNRRITRMSFGKGKKPAISNSESLLVDSIQPPVVKKVRPPVFKTVKIVYRTSLQCLPMSIIGLVGYIVVGFLAGYLSIVSGNSTHFEYQFVFLFTLLGIISALHIAHGKAVLNKNIYPWKQFFTWDYWKYAVSFTCLIGALFLMANLAFYLMVSSWRKILVDRFDDLSKLGIPPLETIAFVSICILSLYASIRSSLVLPELVAGKGLSIKRSWKLARHNLWLLWATLALSLLPINILSLLSGYLFSDVPYIYENYGNWGYLFVFSITLFLFGYQLITFAVATGVVRNVIVDNLEEQPIP